jgi:hypothetical protein
MENLLVLSSHTDTAEDQLNLYGLSLIPQRDVLRRE